MHPFDQDMVQLERAQHGLAALEQLAETWTPGTIRYRTRGRRELIARGVFANPAVAPSFRQRVLAAVLSAGDTAFASHESAASLWKLPLPGPAHLEITTVLGRRPRVRGVRMHRSGLLEAHDVMVVDNIPVATPELAIYSLSSRHTTTVLSRLVDDAVRRRLTTLGRLTALVDRLPPAPGRSRSKMRALLDRRTPGVEARESHLEDFVFAALLRFGLPLPVPQHPVMHAGRLRRIDLCYRDDWLALEAKGFRWYRMRSVWDRDVLRGNELQLAGFRVLSFTSAFTDWEIASQVAHALELPPPDRPSVALSYQQWSRRR